MFSRDNIRKTFTVMHYPVFEHKDTLSFAFLVFIILYTDGKQFRCSVFTFVQYICACFCFMLEKKVKLVGSQHYHFIPMINLIQMEFPSCIPNVGLYIVLNISRTSVKNV